MRHARPSRFVTGTGIAVAPIVGHPSGRVEITLQPLCRLRVALGAALAALVLGPLQAGQISGRVHSDGAPVANAVIHAHPTGEQRLARPDETGAVMDQKNREFVPHVLPVLEGTEVSFPNSDETRHHVYSFSDAKTFELRLYAGTPADPIVFEHTGVVSLGCNIHDWMLGYIFVVSTPAYDKSGEDGAARLSNLPPGEYEVRIWHPRMREGAEPAPRLVDLTANETAPLEYALDLRPPVERKRGFDAMSDEESLEDQF